MQNVTLVLIVMVNKIYIYLISLSLTVNILITRQLWNIILSDTTYENIIEKYLSL